MSNVEANEKKEKVRLFETVLSSPGMSEKCKLQLTLSRHHILLLSRLIEVGILEGESKLDDEIISGFIFGESLEEFRSMHEEILRKANLKDFYERLKML